MLRLFTVTHDYTSRSALPWTKDAAGRPARRQRPAAPAPCAHVPARAPQPPVLPARRAPRRRWGERAAICLVYCRGRHQTRQGDRHRHALALGARQEMAEGARLYAPLRHRGGGHAVGRAQPGAAGRAPRPSASADHPRRHPRRRSVLRVAAHAQARTARAARRQPVPPASRASLRLSGRPCALRRRERRSERRRAQSRALAAPNAARSDGADCETKCDAEELVNAHKNGTAKERVQAAKDPADLAHFNGNWLTFTGLHYTGSAEYGGRFKLSELLEAGYITTFALDGREMLITPREKTWVRLMALILPIEKPMLAHEVDFSRRGVPDTYGAWSANAMVGGSARRLG
ncbi:hypothetical protein FGB62_147g08 [Gracilaria domingensis]|nr:hypothetical protein FGB62_147g08 [Gracilaria domingensis]